MLTVLEAINKSVDYLAKKEIDSPRINAELFLASILNCKRLDLYMMYDRPLSSEEIKKYREFLKRRSSFEPLQYIIGKVEFYGLEFKIAPSVLIPRPETEILVDTVLKNTNDKVPLTILDIGTGSGNIAIAIAKNLPSAKITAIDISEKSINIAKENAAYFKLNNQVLFQVDDIFKLKEENYTDYDIVVSNPPYVSKNEYLKLQNEIKNYEPDFAVTDFSDGFKYFRQIIKVAKKILKIGGILLLEMADGQVNTVKDILINNNFNNILVTKDYSGVERVIYGMKK